MALLAAGCGGRNAAANAPAARPAPVEVTLTEFRFAPDPIEARAGPTIFHLTNDGQADHDFTILSADGRRRLARSPLLAPGAAATLTVTLAAGTYAVICTQPGHQEAGMEAILHVAQG